MQTLDLHDTYDDAAAAANLDTQMIVGARLEKLGGQDLDEPAEVYVVVPREVDDEHLRRLMFQIRNGRSMSDYELFIDELAHRPDGQDDPL